MNQLQQPATRNRLPQGGWGFIVILSALIAFTSLSTDIYLPALPVMGSDLHGNAELTITGFLVGFAFAQLIWGPICDRIGRRRMVVLVFIFFSMNGIVAATSLIGDGRRP